MIPYLQIPSIPIFDRPMIHPFGILVATGILVGASLTVRRGRQLGLLEENVKNMIFWTVFTGFVVSHFFDVLVYQNDLTWSQKLAALADPRSGLSSMGGFAGAVLGLYLWCRRNNEPVLPYADSLAYGLATGWMFGRLGCFVAHDHPGSETKFFLGVDYPCPIPHCFNMGDSLYYVGDRFRRHDLGLYEAISAASLATFYFISERFKPRVGYFVAAIATFYGPVRFFLDYLRIDKVRGADPRYLGLTPAQYAAIAVIAIGIALIVRVSKIPAGAIRADGTMPGSLPAPAGATTSASAEAAAKPADDAKPAADDAGEPPAST